MDTFLQKAAHSVNHMCFFFIISVCLYAQQKCSAQVCVQIKSVVTRNGSINCYILLFKEIILLQLDAFKTEIQGSLTKLCALKASMGHPSKVIKLPITSLGADIIELLNNP